MRTISDISALKEPEQETVREAVHFKGLTAQRSGEAIAHPPSQPVLNSETIAALTLLPMLIIAIALSHRRQQRIIHRQQIYRLEKLWHLSPQNNLER